MLSVTAWNCRREAASIGVLSAKSMNNACRAEFTPAKVSRGSPSDQEVLETLLMTALAGIAPLAARTGAQGLTIKSGHGLRLRAKEPQKAPAAAAPPI